MSDFTYGSPLAERPAAPDSAVDYEVHEYMPGQFVWHLYDRDGGMVLAWSTGQYVGQADDGEATLYGWDGRKIGAHTFRTEYDAHVFVRSTFGLPCRTQFTSAHPDAKVQAFLDADAAG